MGGRQRLVNKTAETYAECGLRGPRRIFGTVPLANVVSSHRGLNTGMGAPAVGTNG